VRSETRKKEWRREKGEEKKRGIHPLLSLASPPVIIKGKKKKKEKGSVLLSFHFLFS